MADSLLEFTDSNFADEVEGADVPVLVDFWSQYCGPCKALTPIIEEVASEMTGRAKVGKINAPENPAVTMKYQVMGLPCVLVFKDGVEVARLAGMGSKDQYVQVLVDNGAPASAPAASAAEGGDAPADANALPTIDPADGPVENSNLLTITDDNFESEVLQSDVPVLVDYWGPGCGPCEILAPTIAEVAESTAGRAKVGKLNVRENPTVALGQKIAGLPTVVVYQNGVEAGRMTGIGTKEHYEKVLADLAASTEDGPASMAS